MTAAAATPVRNRKVANTGMFGTNAQANVPIEKTARHAAMTRILPTRSPTGPYSSWNKPYGRA